MVHHADQKSAYVRCRSSFGLRSSSSMATWNLTFNHMPESNIQSFVQGGFHKLIVVQRIQVNLRIIANCSESFVKSEQDL